MFTKNIEPVQASVPRALFGGKGFCNGMIVLLFVFLSVFPVNKAHSSAMLADLENALMCTCDDKCGKVLGNCTCDSSDKIRMGFAAQLESGLTVQQIIKEQVAKYGESVLSSPTKTGFNITAWVTPFIAIVAGGFGIRKVVQSWAGKKQGKDASEDDKSAVEPTAPTKYSSKLQDELDKLDS
ncbi:MAG: hypothetical protein COV66_09460 [Nitrospinae bacterium CG11_big_fil_rev_8_21_14_0_20_45_15]|nr:MAG: hypothetical protein COV66_09460 [Nitrospinae bacterium CG11_big_fil_rev_8_21_14_0_20_45_15]